MRVSSLETSRLESSVVRQNDRRRLGFIAVACAASFLVGHVSKPYCEPPQGSLEFLPSTQPVHSSQHDLRSGAESVSISLPSPSQYAQQVTIAASIQPAPSCQSAEIICLQGDSCMTNFPIAAGLNGISDIQLLKHVKPFTMVPPGRLAGNLAVVRYIAATNIPGDLVETGVARGGSAASVALATLLAHNPRRLHLYDTFAGLPPADISRDGAAAME
jgi:hypothetical protein